jgi:hypothetical protein
MGNLEFTTAPAPIREPVTKFGGQPVWLSEPAWPLSRTTRRPMRFICQIKLPESVRAGGQEMAYIFMTEEDEYIDGTWEPDGGENAVILQPGSFTPVVTTEPRAAGDSLTSRREIPPTLWQKMQGKLGGVGHEPVELAVREAPAGSSASGAVADADRFGSRIGGEPDWLQNEEWPEVGADGKKWLFLAQIDSAGDAFEVNFGDAGVAYIFVREDGRAARMLWQCL